ncbi:putative alpha/beta hydrolase, partial [Tanacetum coccineum]
FFPERATSLAFSVINELLEELRARPCPLVLTSFSGGSQACMYKVFQIIEGTCEAHLSLDDSRLIMTCISGQMYHTGPVTGDLGARFALHSSTTCLSCQSWYQWLQNASCLVSMLYSLLDLDPNAPSTGKRFTPRLVWELCHYKHYFTEYRAAVNEFFDYSVSIFNQKLQQLAERTGMEGMHDKICELVCDLQNAAVDSNQSLRRVAVGPNDHFFLPSSAEYQSSKESGSLQDEQKERRAVLLASPPSLNPHSVLGQVLFDVCVPKNIEGWDIKFDNRKPFGSPSRKHSSLNALKRMRRSRL